MARNDPTSGAVVFADATTVTAPSEHDGKRYHGVIAGIPCQLLAPNGKQGPRTARIKFREFDTTYLEYDIVHERIYHVKT